MDSFVVNIVPNNISLVIIPTQK